MDQEEVSALAKTAYPHLFCPVPGCLTRNTEGRKCRVHVEDELRKELAESKAETAAALQFLGVEMGWEHFRAEMLYFDDAIKTSSSEENARKLKNYLAETGHGVRFLRERDHLAEQLKAAQDNATHWACRATEEAECNKPLRTDNAQLRKALISLHANTLAGIAVSDRHRLIDDNPPSNPPDPLDACQASSESLVPERGMLVNHAQ